MKTLISAKIEPGLLRDLDEALPDGKTRTWAIEEGFRLLLKAWKKKGAVGWTPPAEPKE